MPAFLDPKEAEFWVGVGLLLFFAVLMLVKAPRAVFGALDAKAARIQADLDEAQRLRQEAEALLASLRAERADAEKRAAEMMVNAQAEARQMEADARARLEEQIARRAALAERRIAIAEQQAAQDVKAAAADIAARAAEIVLAQHVGASQNDPMIDRAIGQLAAKMG